MCTERNCSTDTGTQRDSLGFANFRPDCRTRSSLRFYEANLRLAVSLDLIKPVERQIDVRN